MSLQEIPKSAVAWYEPLLGRGPDSTPTAKVGWNGYRCINGPTCRSFFLNRFSQRLEEMISLELTRPRGRRMRTRDTLMSETAKASASMPATPLPTHLRDSIRINCIHRVRNCIPPAASICASFATVPLSHLDGAIALRITTGARFSVLGSPI